jgi:molybdenum cofactor biosynthesis enzyme MoaA
MLDKDRYNKFKNYNFLPILKDMIKRDILRNNGHVSFGGGEVTLLKEFDKLLHMFIDAGFPLTRIHSSCIKYSKAIERGLKEGKVDLIVSVDAGSKEMHRKIKQVRSYDRVWKNLKRYASHQKDPYAVKAKYILIPGINDKREEIDLWLQKAKENGVNCVFHEIESKWFYGLRDRNEEIPQDILSFFDYAREKAEALGLKYVLYERAEHMMEYIKDRNEKKGADNAGVC